MLRPPRRARPIPAHFARRRSRPTRRLRHTRKAENVPRQADHVVARLYAAARIVRAVMCARARASLPVALCTPLERAGRKTPCMPQLTPQPTRRCNRRTKQVLKSACARPCTRSRREQRVPRAASRPGLCTRSGQIQSNSLCSPPDSDQPRPCGAAPAHHTPRNVSVQPLWRPRRLAHHDSCRNSLAHVKELART